MNVKYVVVNIDVVDGAIREFRRIEFDNVDEAIEKHKDKARETSNFSCWDLVVEYE